MSPALLLDEIHDRHYGGWLRQLDAELFHNWPEVRQELIKGFLTFPDVEDLKLAIFTEAGVELHRALRCTGLAETVATLSVLLESHVLGDDVDGNHGEELLVGLVAL